ncbi:hypothetical protein [Desulfurella sp.]|mgnify:CR=1 FL=1|uniref:hypothetical protein n=1 Tax=Desulfurella sp. TaxID=1962857 RepID=UPI0025C1D16B|nr:hypothetical protein [Desulfurella sp.]
MKEKVIAKVKKENDKLHLTCEAFGISEYCIDEEQAKAIVESKAPKDVEIEWVKDYIEKDK